MKDSDDSTDKREGEPKAEALGLVEPRAARRQRGGPALPPELAAAVLEAAGEIKERFKADVSGRAVAEQAGWLFSRVLWPRHPGKPRHADVDEAMRLEQTGVRRQQIYRRLGKSDPLSKHALRQAMRQRRIRARRRATAAQATNSAPIVTPTKSAEYVESSQAAGSARS
jgi:hypothetical protein